MQPTTLNPYLMFKDNCREAMSFYQHCLGGELTVSTYGEADPQCSEDQKEYIIHALLKSGDMTIMASDWSHSIPGYTLGTDIQLSIGGDDETALRDVFEKLSAEGTVKMKLEKQFWGDTFGSLRDKFGINWMVNISGKKD